MSDTNKKSTKRGFGHILSRMKPALFLTAFLAGIATICSAQAQQDTWSKYKPRTIQSVVAAHQEQVVEIDSSSPLAENKLLLSADSFPSKVKLVFLGKSRPMPQKRRELLQAWKKMLKYSVPDDVVDKFSVEMLFREGDKELWVAVQTPLLEALPQEVRLGQSFTAYVVWMGAIKAADRWEWLFAMNEFDAPATSRATTSQQIIGAITPNHQ